MEEETAETKNQEAPPSPQKEEETKAEEEGEEEQEETKEEKEEEEEEHQEEEEEEEEIEKKKKQKKAQIAVIGCGWWSQGWHIPHLLSNNDKVTICALVNKDDQPTSTLNENLLNMEELAKLCGDSGNCPPIYKSVQELMNDYNVASTMNGAIICTPHSTHYEIAETLIQEGMNRIIPSMESDNTTTTSNNNVLHILLEKPMTTDVKEAKKLHELAHCYWRTCRNAFTRTKSKSVRSTQNEDDTNAITNTSTTTPGGDDGPDADAVAVADGGGGGEDAEAESGTPTGNADADADAEGAKGGDESGTKGEGGADGDSGGESATEIGDADGEHGGAEAAEADAAATAATPPPPPPDHHTTTTTTIASKGGIIMPYFQLNHSANFRKQTQVAKDLIQEQKMIGTIRHINASMASPLSWLFGHPKNWNWNQPTQEGMLGNGFAWGQVSHLLAWIYHVAGEELIPLQVYCIMNHSDTSGADLSHSATIKCRNNITFSLAGTCLLPGNEHGDPPIGKEISIEIYGSDGALFYRGNDHDPSSGKLEIRMGNAAASAVKNEVVVEGSAKVYCQDLGFHFENTDQEGRGPESLQSFIAACCGETDYYEGADSLVGLRSIQTLDAMYRSHHSGTAEDIKG